MRNPFNRYNRGFDMSQKSALDLVNVGIGAGGDVEKRLRVQQQKSQAEDVRLPRHLFIPEGAESVDIRRLVLLAPASNDVILELTNTFGSTLFFTHYAIFNDALDASLVEFVPTIDNRRIYPYHGNPQDNFRIALGLAPDLSNTSLIEGQLQVDPGRTVRWRAINNDVVNVIMGVRMKGYIDSATIRPNRRFGG